MNRTNKVFVRIVPDERFDHMDKIGSIHLEALRKYLARDEVMQIKQGWPNDEDELYTAQYDSVIEAEDAVEFLNFLGEHIFEPESYVIATRL